jgi:hypothetical protein
VLAACALSATGALALSACGGGGGGGTDRNGFTSNDRAAAQAALNSLQPTAVPDTVVQLTATSGLPAACKVHLVTSNPPRFTLWIDWTPINHQGAMTTRAMSWVKAQIGLSGVNGDTLKSGFIQSIGDRQTAYNKLRATAGNAFSNPSEDCQLLANGDLALLPAS